MRADFVVHPDGTITSNPMEDMSPPLSREELRANMIALAGE